MLIRLRGRLVLPASREHFVDLREFSGRLVIERTAYPNETPSDGDREN
jgi:hypothetical protein